MFLLTLDPDLGLQLLSSSDLALARHNQNQNDHAALDRKFQSAAWLLTMRDLYASAASFIASVGSGGFSSRERNIRQSFSVNVVFSRASMIARAFSWILSRINAILSSPI